MRACEHCGEQVPVAQATLHDAFCRRNNVRCQVCSRAIRKVASTFEPHSVMCAG